jgi:hypothetical protein
MPSFDYVEIDNDYSNALSSVITTRIRFVERVDPSSPVMREHLLLPGPPRRICSRIPNGTHTRFGRHQKWFERQ